MRSYRAFSPFFGVLSVIGPALILLAVSCSLAAAQRPSGKPELGRWDEVPEAVEKLRRKHQEEMEALNAVGYVAGSEPVPEAVSLTRYEPERAYSGYNLVVSGHAQECTLMNMQGNPLHSWAFDYPARFPDREMQYNNMWFMCHVYENGDLLVLQDGFGVFRLDHESNLLWDYPSNAHHDFSVIPNGNIYILESEADVFPSITEEYPLREDFITELDPDGTFVRRVSIYRALVNGGYENLLRDALKGHLGRRGDPLHTNTVEYLDGTLEDEIPAFREGNLLISCRSISTVMVINPDTETAEWVMRGEFKAQHCPEVLKDGTILLFDNEGGENGSVVREIDPHTGQDVWQYAGTESEPFYSRVNSRCHRLPNGNTLIVASVGGRVFEVTPGKEIVWEYFNPHRAGPNEKFIARIFEVVRLPITFPISWASSTRQGNNELSK